MNFYIKSDDLVEQFSFIIKKHNFFLKDAASSYAPTLTNGRLEIRLSVDRTIVEAFLVIGKEFVEIEHLFVFLYPDKNLEEEKRLVMKGIEVSDFIAYQIRCYAELIQQKMPFVLETTWEIPQKYLKKKALCKNIRGTIRSKYFNLLDLRHVLSRLDIDIAIRELQKKGVEIPPDILEILDKYEQEQR